MAGVHTPAEPVCGRHAAGTVARYTCSNVLYCRQVIETFAEKAGETGESMAYSRNPYGESLLQL